MGKPKQAQSALPAKALAGTAASSAITVGAPVQTVPINPHKSFGQFPSLSWELPIIFPALAYQ